MTSLRLAFYFVILLRFGLLFFLEMRMSQTSWYISGVLDLFNRISYWKLNGKSLNYKRDLLAKIIICASELVIPSHWGPPFSWICALLSRAGFLVASGWLAVASVATWFLVHLCPGLCASAILDSWNSLWLGCFGHMNQWLWADWLNTTQNSPWNWGPARGEGSGLPLGQLAVWGKHSHLHENLGTWEGGVTSGLATNNFLCA